MIPTEMIQNITIKLGQSSMPTVIFATTPIQNFTSNSPMETMRKKYGEFIDEQVTQTIASSTNKLEHSKPKEREGILIKFRNIVTYAINELFPPRLILKHARKFIEHPSSFLAKAIHICIKERLSEEGLGENLNYLRANICFSSKMDNLSKEFLEEYLAMSATVEAAKLIEQCKENLDINSPSMEQACASEFVNLGGTVLAHRSKNLAMVSKLQTAAENCAERENASLRNEEQMNKKKYGKFS